MVEQLGDERPGAHPGHVGLGDADDPVDVAGTDAGAGAGPPDNRVGRRHERVGAVVEVEEGALRPFQQHLPARLEGLVQQGHRVRDVGRQPGRALAEVLLGDLGGPHGQAVEHLGQDLVGVRQGHVELGPEDARVEQVLHPQPDAHRPVGVGGPDAPLGGAQLRPAEVALMEGVQLLVVGHDQVGVARQTHRAAVDAPGLQGVHLRDEDPRVDHHAVADHRGDVVVEHPAGDQLQGEGLAADHEGVAGVVAALVADHHVHLGSDEVGELALPLVAPLGTDDDSRRHGALLLGAGVTWRLYWRRTADGAGLPQDYRGTTAGPATRRCRPGPPSRCRRRRSGPPAGRWPADRRRPAGSAA